MNDQFELSCQEILLICRGLRAALNVALTPGRRTLDPIAIETARNLTAHFENALSKSLEAAKGGSESDARQAIDGLNDACAHLKEMSLFIPPEDESSWKEA